MNCEYVRDCYGVPTEIGRRVIVYGKAGIIAADRGNYIGVTFDTEQARIVRNCHPTDCVEYLPSRCPWLEKRQGAFCKETPHYPREQGWGYTKDLAEKWLLSCPRCCAEAGGAVREIANDGGAGAC